MTVHPALKGAIALALVVVAILLVALQVQHLGAWLAVCLISAVALLSIP